MLLQTYFILVNIAVVQMTNFITFWEFLQECAGVGFKMTPTDFSIRVLQFCLDSNSSAPQDDETGKEDVCDVQQQGAFTGYT